MREGDDDGERNVTLPDGPLPNRLNGATLRGCLGIICVLALPAMLFLPVETWHAPAWLTRLVPLVAVGIAMMGTWLLTRVPAGSPPRSLDPLHPLTGAGHAPVEERPAGAENRAGLLAALLLCLGCIAGYLEVSFGTGRQAALLATLLAGAAGCGLIIYSLLAALRRLPVPAWRWLRLPIDRGDMAQQPAPLGLAGLIAFVWSLFVAAGEGYSWAPVGVGMLILAGALVGPALQRLPPSGSKRARDEWR